MKFKKIVFSNGSMSTVTSSLMSMGLQCGWPSLSMFGVNSAKSVDADPSSGNIYACNNGGDYYTGQCALKLGSPADHAFTQQPSSFRANQFPSQSCFPTTKVAPVPIRVSSYPNPVHGSSSFQQPLQRYPLYSGGTQYNANRPRSGTKTPLDGSKLHEWQEGFRALLPNVNVRFVSDLNATGLFFLVLLIILWQVANIRIRHLLCLQYDEPHLVFPSSHFGGM